MKTIFFAKPDGFVIESRYRGIRQPSRIERFIAWFDGACFGQRFFVFLVPGMVITAFIVWAAVHWKFGG